MSVKSKLKFIIRKNMETRKKNKTVLRHKYYP